MILIDWRFFSQSDSSFAVQCRFAYVWQPKVEGIIQPGCIDKQKLIPINPPFIHPNSKPKFHYANDANEKQNQHKYLSKQSDFRGDQNQYIKMFWLLAWQEGLIILAKSIENPRWISYSVWPFVIHCDWDPPLKLRMNLLLALSRDSTFPVWLKQISIFFSKMFISFLSVFMVFLIKRVHLHLLSHE